MADDKLTRKDLISQVNRISKEILPLLPNSHQAYRINELLSDINSDYYTVVVVGEFNNGKSTFVNAIIGEDLLPMGVTPTTATINTLTWGEDRSLSINREGEKVEDMPLSKRFLERFIADADFDTEAVKYIRLTLPVDILKDKVMLIDTPGVADLNQQRVEITYGFIPRADAVIFLLNATTPMRRTEMEFLNETILKESSNQIIFVANYFDYIDEDEQDDILNEIKIRIQAAVGKKEPPVYSLSAKRALEARLSGNQKELEESGILEIETEIKNMIENGNQEHQKVMHFKNRLNRILYDIHQEITSTLNIYRASGSFTLLTF